MSARNNLGVCVRTTLFRIKKAIGAVFVSEKGCRCQYKISFDLNILSNAPSINLSPASLLDTRVLRENKYLVNCRSDGRENNEKRRVLCKVRRSINNISNRFPI